MNTSIVILLIVSLLSSYVYAAPTLYSLGAFSRSFTGYSRPRIVDIDQDGKKDIVVVGSDSTGGIVKWYQNNGGYSFQERSISTYGTTFSWPVNYPADLDRDGDIDIFYFAFNTTGAYAIIQENVNKGASWKQHDYVFYTDPAHDISTVGLWDYNNDGWIDIYFETFDKNQVKIYQNYGNWNFVWATFNQAPKPKYTYGDLTPVTWVQNGVTINGLFSTSWSTETGYLTYNNGTFTHNNIGSDGVYNGISSAVGDFNADGKPDFVAVGNNCWNGRYFLNNGGTSGWPITPVGAPNSPNWACGLSSRIAAGDIDADGYDDVVYAYSNKQTASWGTPSANPSTTVAFAVVEGFYTASSPPQISIGSLYNYGKAFKDVVFVDSTGLHIYGVCNNCQSCGSGSYIDASLACVACPAGFTSTGPGASTCTPCPGGSYSTTPGGVCIACNSSTATPGGSVPCSGCPQNYYPKSGTYCAPCPNGYFSSAGANTCVACPAGTARAGSQAFCSNCAAGTYAAAGSELCNLCGAGTISDGTAPSCTQCSAGTYSSSITGGTTCTACPPGKTSGSGAFFCY